jgi:hypothetical protein
LEFLQLHRGQVGQRELRGKVGSQSRTFSRLRLWLLLLRLQLRLPPFLCNWLHRLGLSLCWPERQRGRGESGMEGRRLSGEQWRRMERLLLRLHETALGSLQWAQLWRSMSRLLQRHRRSVVCKGS